MTKYETMKSQELATIVPATQVIMNGESKIAISGVIALIKRQSSYYFLFRQTKSPNLRQTPDYSICSGFNPDESDINCVSILKMVFTEFKSENDDLSIKLLIPNRNNLLLTVYLQDPNPNSQLFVIQTQKIHSISLFVQELLSHGIVLPLFPNHDHYELIFYKFSNEYFFYTCPSHLQISHFTFVSLESFWSDVIQYFRELIQYLFDCDCIRKDNNYKLGLSANSMLIPIKESFSTFVENVDIYQHIPKDEFESLYNPQGQLIDPDGFNKRLFAGGCDVELLPQIIPYAIGLYKYDSSQSERLQIDEKLKKDYLVLKDQLATITERQLSRNKKLRESFRVIVQDAERTDRSQNAFKNRDQGGMSLLIHLLRCYCLYNQRICYLQGMNDLFVPIILAYLPNWDEEGNPIDSNGNVITDLLDFESHIFWSFVFFIEKLNHTSLLENITSRSIQISHNAISLLFQIEPLVSLWLMQNSLCEFFWMYSDFVYLFKRSFTNIWETWLQFACSPSPETWIVYFVSVIIIDMFHSMSSKSELSITEMMEAYPKYIEQCNPNDIGKKALYLYEKFPLQGYTYVSTELNIEQNDEIETSHETEQIKHSMMSEFLFCEFDIP